MRTWPLLGGWLAEDREKLRLLERIQRSAEEWDQGGKRDVMLVHRNGRLNDAEALLANPRFWRQHTLRHGHSQAREGERVDPRPVRSRVRKSLVREGFARTWSPPSYSKPSHVMEILPAEALAGDSGGGGCLRHDWSRSGRPMSATTPDPGRPFGRASTVRPVYS